MAYKDDPNSNKDTSDYGSQLMGIKDGTALDATHCNKLGGFITAAYVTKAIKDLKDADGNSLNIATAIKAPTAVAGMTIAGKTVFTINNAGTFTAYDKLQDYEAEAEYWTEKGAELIDAAVSATGN